MLTAIKELLRGLLAPTLYAGVFVTFLASVFKRAEWGLYLLAILAPLPVLWYGLHQFPLGKDTIDILIFGVMLGIVFNKNGFDRAPGAILIGIFMLVSFASLWNSTVRFELPLPFTSANPILADWKNYVEMIFLYFLAYNALKTEEHQKIMLVIMASVVLLISLREFRNFTEGDVFSYDRRAEGPFWIVGLGANHLGAFVADYGGLLLGMYLIDKHKYRKWLYLAGAVLSVHPLFFSYSRGAYIAALAVVIVYGLIRKRSLLALVAALLFAWHVVLPPTVVERIEMTQSQSGELESSAAERLDLWEHAKQLFTDHPVFGIGFNSFGFTMPHGSLTDTHNFYLKTASEQGVIGIILITLVLLRALKNGWRLYRTGHSAFHQGLGLGFIGCVTALAVSNIFGDRFSYFALGSYFWLFWGMVDRAIQLAENQPHLVTSEDTAEPSHEATV